MARAAASGVDDGADTGPGGDIRADKRSANPGGGRLTSPFVEIGDDHVHALGSEPLSDPCAYPVRPPVTTAVIPSRSMLALCVLALTIRQRWRRPDSQRGLSPKRLDGQH
jgi:hypothetical protein